MDKREKARELWEESGGTKQLKEIAEELGVSPATVRTWKRRDQWGEPPETQREFQRIETQRETNRKRQSSVNRSIAEHLDNAEELTEAEKDFCIHYITTYNAAQSAWRTGRYTSYNAAKVDGHRMLHKPSVQAEIRKLKEMKRAAILADLDDLVEMHMRIAFADITEFVEFGRETVAVMGPFGPITVKVPGRKERVTLTKEVNSVRFKEHTEVDGTLLAEVKQGTNGASIRLVDRQKSLAFLERYFMANPMDRHKKAYDEARLKLDQEKLQSGNEEALEKLDEILKEVQQVMDHD